MFVNMHMKKFNLSDFQNICRICMSETDLHTLQDGHRKILNLISKVQFSKTDELPQKICEKCVRKVNDVTSLALLCKRIDQTLKKYLENLKLENIAIDVSPLDRVEKIEFIDVNDHVDLETNHVKMELDRLKGELARAELDEEARALKIEEATPPGPIPADVTPAGPITANVTPSEPITAVVTPVGPITATVTPSEPITTNLLKRAAQSQSRPHKTSQSKPRPYKCGYCVRTFTKNGMRRMHERQIHSAASKYKCYRCATVYPTATALKNHKRTHRPIYECDTCPRYFQSKVHLENHQKTHQDSYKPYECLICFKRFNLLASYLKHNSVHDIFPCDVCDRTCKSAGSLTRHKRTHK